MKEGGLRTTAAGSSSSGVPKAQGQEDALPIQWPEIRLVTLERDPRGLVTGRRFACAPPIASETRHRFDLMDSTGQVPCARRLSHSSAESASRHARPPVPLFAAQWNIAAPLPFEIMPKLTVGVGVLCLCAPCGRIPCPCHLEKRL